MLEQSLFIIKPDAMQKKVYGDIITRLMDEFVITYMQSMQLTETQVREHYAHINHLPTFDEMVEFMVSEKVIVMIVEGDKAISRVRKMVGATFNAEPGTIRGDYGAEAYRTLVHASDSRIAAEEEIRRFFGANFLEKFLRRE